MEALPYTVISSQNQYKAYCEELADLISTKNKTRVQLDTVALLRLLIKCWDEEQRPLSDSDPVEFLKSLMEQHATTKVSDLAADLGISISLLSDILHYRRRLSREVIRKLAFRFQVPQELLNKPYNLVRAAAKPAKSPRSISPSTGPIRHPAQATGQTKTQPFATPNWKEEPVVRLLEERAGTATIARLKNGKEITIWNVMSGRRLADPSPYFITNLKPRITHGESDIFFASAIRELIDPDGGEVIFRADG
jgi:HTH-type transcriptional regulator/antitoxin HigA